RVAQSIDVTLDDDVRLIGEVEHVYRSNGRLLLFDAKPSGTADFRALMTLYLDYAALRLSLGDGAEIDFVEYDGNAACPARRPALLKVIATQTPAQLRSGLRSLIDAFREGLAQPLLFFPKTAWAWAKTTQDKRDTAAHGAWYGNESHTGERDYAPGYAALLTRDLDFLAAQSKAHEYFVEVTQRVAEALDPGHSVLLMQAPDPSANVKSSMARK
ncbi:MAG: exodeoxyribonuclease V subunit gamma, partial [Rudaea sp.]